MTGNHISQKDVLPVGAPMEELFLRRFAEALERADDVKMEDDFRGYEEWDSLSLLVILSMVDDEYDVSINSNQFVKMKTVKDIFEFVVKNPDKNYVRDSSS
mgnify:CR=1 FL=1